LRNKVLSISAPTPPASRSPIYVEKVMPKKLVLVHGEVESRAWFEALFAETLTGTEIILPRLHMPVDLW
jgi:hypothetical protein